MDYKGLRKILSTYCKTDLVDRKLDGKAGREFTTKRLDHTENIVDNILETLDELWFVIKRKEAFHPKDGGSAGECASGEEPLNNNEATPSTNIRSMVSIEEEGQSKAQARSEGFGAGECDQPVSENSAPQTARPTTMPSRRDASSIRLSQRPVTSPGNLPYYITSKSKRRESSTQKQHF